MKLPITHSSLSLPSINSGLSSTLRSDDLIAQTRREYVEGMAHYSESKTNYQLPIQRFWNFIRNWKLESGNSRGFTLVEMIVVVMMFSLVLVAVSDIFVRAQRAARRTSALAKLQDSTRFIMEKISSDIRTGSFDYAYYTAQNPLSAQGNTQLALINSEGKKIIYSSSDSDSDCTAANTPCVIIEEKSGATSIRERLTPEGVRIIKDENDKALLTFFIAPLVDPFATDENGDYLSNTQPRVTINLSANSRVPGIDEPVKLITQTTVVTREYKR